VVLHASSTPHCTAAGYFFSMISPLQRGSKRRAAPCDNFPPSSARQFRLVFCRQHHQTFAPFRALPNTTQTFHENLVIKLLFKFASCFSQRLNYGFFSAIVSRRTSRARSNAILLYLVRRVTEFLCQLWALWRQPTNIFTAS